MLSKRLLMALAGSAHLRDFIIRFPITKRMSRRFVAGETLEEAIGAVKPLNQRGVMATIDHLGEDVLSREEATTAAQEYLGILDRMRESGVDSNVSLKLTQMGLDIDMDFCLRNVEMVAERAKGCENFVRIDIEGSPHTQRTLEIYEKARAEYDNVGVAIQAYLYRSEEDIRRLIPKGLNVRLCKGAYLEPPQIAFPKKSQVDDNFIKLMGILFAKEARAAGCYPAIATHDEHMIDWALDHVRKNGINRDGFELQMLYGIRCDLQDRLAREGYRVRAYVPYGTHWYPYFMRRLGERPANLIFLLRNIVRA